jgi:hypothetical protein
MVRDAGRIRLQIAIGVTVLVVAAVVVYLAAFRGDHDTARTIQLPVFVDEQRRPAPWSLVVPVPEGWRPVVERGQPIAALMRSLGRDCVLLVQLAASGSSGPPHVPTWRRLSNVQRGSRSVLVEGDARDVRFGVRSITGEARSLVFSGGATGPGGASALTFQPAQGRQGRRR